MRHFFYLCLIVLPIFGCQSIDIDRYLESLYCPEAFVVKGAEQIKTAGVSARLYQLETSCEVSGGGDITERSFKPDRANFQVNLSGKLEQPNSSNLRIFIWLMRVKDKKILQQKNFVISAKKDSIFSRAAYFDLPAVTAKQYVVIAGFLGTTEKTKAPVAILASNDIGQ